MSILESIILGIVEGITEFLPISSTGHLILTSEILRISATEYAKSFEIVIQTGAILAVVYLYWSRIINNSMLWRKLFVSFLPSALVGFLLYKFIKNYLLESSLVVVCSLFIGGILLIVFEKWYSTKNNKNISIGSDVENKTTEITDNLENISYKQALIIGIFQAFSIIPGVSRSGATIVGGLFAGLQRTAIVEFSFLLAIPTIFAASGYDFIKNYSQFRGTSFFPLAVGFIVSFFVAVLTIRFFLKYIKTHTFSGFGIYRIFISILFFLVFLL